MAVSGYNIAAGQAGIGDYLNMLPVLGGILGKLRQACFTEGTHVVVGYDEEGVAMTRNIEDIREGDWVLAKDENNQDGEPVLKQVTKVWIKTVTQLRVLTLTNEAGDEQVIETTEEHPSVEGKGWINDGQLQGRDQIMNCRWRRCDCQFIDCWSNQPMDLTRELGRYQALVDCWESDDEEELQRVRIDLREYLCLHSNLGKLGEADELQVHPFSHFPVEILAIMNIRRREGRNTPVAKKRGHSSLSPSAIMVSLGGGGQVAAGLIAGPGFEITRCGVVGRWHCGGFSFPCRSGFAGRAL